MKLVKTMKGHILSATLKSWPQEVGWKLAGVNSAEHNEISFMINVVQLQREKKKKKQESMQMDSEDGHVDDSITKVKRRE